MNVLQESFYSAVPQIVEICTICKVILECIFNSRLCKTV